MLVLKSFSTGGQKSGKTVWQGIRSLGWSSRTHQKHEGAENNNIEQTNILR